MSNSEKEGVTQQIIIRDRNSGIMSFFTSAIKIGVAVGVFALVFASFKGTDSKDSSVSYETKYESYNEYFATLKQSEKKTPVTKYAKNMYLIDFVGSPSGEEVEKLRRDIDFILLNSKPGEEVAVRLTSPGGAVITYGLAASELSRLKAAGLVVTVMVDKVAASGGYMMAVVSDKIIAAPFAFVGSVGVVAQMPIYEDLLKNFGVEYKVYTAGDHKRSVISQLKPTPEDELKLREDLEKIHAQFKAHVKKNRPTIDIDKVANGQVFSGQEALDLKLIDEVSTSSDYLLKQYNKNVGIVYVYTNEIKNSGSMGGLKASVDGIVEHFAASLMNEYKKEVYNPYQNIQ